MGSEHAKSMKFGTWAARLLGSAVSLAACLPLSADEVRQQWTFRVYLDDREIGFHEFRVSGTNDAQQVEINAEFKVKVLFINAYQYEHRNREQWQGNCLADIESQTNDNGKQLSVSGEFVEGGFVVETREAAELVDTDCLRSFAYWNPVILRSERLLNSQTGELVDVNVTRAGADTIRFGNAEITATKYLIEMEEGPISLWYTPDEKQWLALEAPAKGGRMIRYEPVILPDWPTEGASLAMK